MNDEDEIEDDDEDEGDDDDGGDQDGYIWWMRAESNQFYVSFIYQVIPYWGVPSCPKTKWF